MLALLIGTDTLDNQADTDSSYNAITLARYTGTCGFVKTVSGTFNNINRVTAPNNLQINHEYLFELTVEGTSLTGKITDLTNNTVEFNNTASYSHTINPKNYIVGIWGLNGAVTGILEEIKIEAL